MERRPVAVGALDQLLGLASVAPWPGTRQANGEIYGVEPGEWKRE